MTRKFTGRRSFTTLELARQLTGERAPRVLPSDRLRAIVVLDLALRLSGLQVTEFGRRYVEPPDPVSNADGTLIFKWLSGNVIPSPRKLERIFQAFPAVEAIYKSPFFTLLENRPITVSEVNSLLKKFSAHAPGVAWTFTPDSGDLFHQRWPGVPMRHATSRLRDRGDLDGLAVILGLVREAEVLGETRDHAFAMADLYRGLSAVLANSSFKKHTQLLFHCVQQIHARNDSSLGIVKPNWERIEAHATEEHQAEFRGSIDREEWWRKKEREKYDFVEFNFPDWPAYIEDPFAEAGPKKKKK